MGSRSFELATAPLYGAKGGPELRAVFFRLRTASIGAPCAQSVQGERLDSAFASLRALNASYAPFRSFQIRDCGVSGCNGSCCLFFPLVHLPSAAFLLLEFLFLSPAQSHEGFRDCGRFAHEVSLSSPLLLDLRLYALHAFHDAN